MALFKGAEGGLIPRRRLRRALFALAVGLLLVIVTIFLFVGKWLVVEDPLQTSAAIAVLSGGMPLRALEAAKLYRQGYAPKVLLTHPSEPADALAALGISYLSEDAYDQQILIREGVPKEAIQVLAPPIRNTADEISTISDALELDGTASVIIVTSKVHTRRTRVLWQRLVRGRAHLLVHAVSDDPFHPGRWWATTTDALDVVREVLGILNAWAGLPLHPTN